MADQTADTSTPTPADMPQQKQQGEPSGIDALPEWAQKELKSVREEAAKYRTRAKEFADDGEYARARTALDQLDKLEQAKKSDTERLTEEKESLLYEASTAKEKLLRFQAAVKAGFVGDEAEDIALRLRGSDEEEFLSDAQKLRELIRPQEKRPVADHSQGRVAGGNSPGDLLAAEINKRFGR